eukprot:g2124.t1
MDATHCGFTSFCVAGPDTCVFGTDAGVRVCRFNHNPALSATRIAAMDRDYVLVGSPGEMPRGDFAVLPPAEDFVLNDSPKLSSFFTWTKKQQSVLLVHRFPALNNEHDFVYTFSTDAKLRLMDVKRSRGHATRRCDVTELLDEDQFSLRIASVDEYVVVGSKKFFLMKTTVDGLVPLREVVTTHPTLLPDVVELTQDSLFLLFRRGGTQMDDLLHIDVFGDRRPIVRPRSALRGQHADSRCTDSSHPVHTWQHDEHLLFQEERNLATFAEGEFRERLYDRFVVNVHSASRDDATLADCLREFAGENVVKRQRLSDGSAVQGGASRDGSEVSSLSPAAVAVSAAAVRGALEKRCSNGNFSQTALDFIELCRDRERRRKTLCIGRVRCYEKFCTARGSANNSYAPVARLTASGFSVVRPAYDLPWLIGEGKMHLSLAALTENPHSLPEIKKHLVDESEVPADARQVATQGREGIQDLDSALATFRRRFQSCRDNSSAALLPTTNPSSQCGNWSLGDFLLSSIAFTELQAQTRAMADMFFWMAYHKLPAVGGMLLDEGDSAGGDSAEKLLDFLELQVPFQRTVLEVLSMESSSAVFANSSGGAQALKTMRPRISLLDEYVKHVEKLPESQTVPLRPISYENVNVGLLLVRSFSHHAASRGAAGAAGAGAPNAPAAAQLSPSESILWPAIVHFTEALPNADPVSALYFRARYLLSNGEIDQATECFLQERVVENTLNPESMWAASIPHENPQWAALVENMSQRTSTRGKKPRVSYDLHVAAVLAQDECFRQAFDFLVRAARFVEQGPEVVVHGEPSTSEGGQNEVMRVERPRDQFCEASAVPFWLAALDFALEHGLWHCCFELINHQLPVSDAKRYVVKFSFLLRKNDALSFLIPQFGNLQRVLQDAVLSELIEQDCEHTLYTIALVQGQELRAAYIARRMYDKLVEESDAFVAERMRSLGGVQFLQVLQGIGHFGGHHAEEIAPRDPMLYGEFYGTNGPSLLNGAAAAENHAGHGAGIGSSAANHQQLENLAEPAYYLAADLLHAVPTAHLRRQRDTLLMALTAKSESDYLYLDASLAGRGVPGAAIARESASSGPSSRAPTGQQEPSAVHNSGVRVGQSASSSSTSVLGMTTASKSMQELFNQAESAAAERVVTTRDLRRKIQILEARIFLSDTGPPLAAEIREDTQVIADILASTATTTSTRAGVAVAGGGTGAATSVAALLHDPRYLASKLAQHGLGLTAVQLCSYFEGIDVFRFAVRPFLDLILRMEQYCETAGVVPAGDADFRHGRSGFSSAPQSMPSCGPSPAWGSPEISRVPRDLVRTASQTQLLSGMFLQHDSIEATVSATATASAKATGQDVVKALWHTMDAITLNTQSQIPVCDYLLERQPLSPLPTTVLQFFHKQEYSSAVAAGERDQFAPGERDQFFDVEKRMAGRRSWTDLLRILMKHGRLDEVMALLEKKVERRGIAGLDEGAEPIPVHLILHLRKVLQQCLLDKKTQHLEVLSQCIHKLDRMLKDLE